MIPRSEIYSCGTSHFVSKEFADEYYRSCGYPDADVLLAEGAINLGPPPHTADETLEVIAGEGRYRIRRQEKPVTVVTRSLGDEIALLRPDADKIYLPATQLSKYAEIKRMLETSGGRYNSKGYFSFPEGVEGRDVFAALLVGKVLNGKKDSQSFFTPEDLAYQVCAAAGQLEGKRVLEPSAGDGRLADIAESAGAFVVVVENYPPNIAVLRRKGYEVIERDFLTVTPGEIGKFMAIVANPPFAPKNRDIDHVIHMWTFLEPGGVLSVKTSQSWRHGSQKKQRTFRDFLEKHNAEVVEIESGLFKESGTNIGTLHVRIQKPDQADTIASTQHVACQANNVQLGLTF